MQMNEMIKQFQNIFLIDLNLKPSIVLKINDAIPNSEKNTVAYVIEHYSAIAKNLSSNERQDLRKALKEVGVPDGLLPGKGRPKHDDSVRDLNLVGRPIEEDAPDEELESPVEFEEPKESALKESVEKVKESVKVLTDCVKDAVSETISGNVIVDGPMKMVEDVRQNSIIVITPFNAVRVEYGSMAYMAALNVFYGFEVVDKARRELEKAEEMLQQAREELALLMEDEDGNT